MKKLSIKAPIDEWKSSFGNEYQQRNASNWKSIKNRSRLFGDILNCMENSCKAFPTSVLEIGAGAGDNLRAIDMIYERTKTPIKLMACDPNRRACEQLSDIAITTNCNLKSLSYDNDVADLVFTSGVLIHIPPNELDKALSEIYRTSKRWILAIEYFNDTPDEIEYRSMNGMLWRRDWGEKWLGNYPSLKPIGYGFAWKRLTGLDNITWFLFEKAQP
jgi:pseudaminic acid biosynthesis-associated methylase